MIGKRIYNVYFFVLSLFSFVSGYMILTHGTGDFIVRFGRHMSPLEHWLVSIVMGIAFMAAPAYYWYHAVRHLLAIQKRPKRNS